MCRYCVFLLTLVFMVSLGCATTSAPAAPTSSPTFKPFILPSDPVPYSKVGTELGESLSSGLSIPDLVDTALLSVVEIRAGVSGGTGFLIADNGLVVTNKHVIAGNTTARLRLTSGREYMATVVKEHPSLDLAYLKIESSDTFTPISLGNSGNVRVGEEVIVIGFPLGPQLGQEPTVSRGIVSAIRQDQIQTDAPMNPGNSGGPLLNQYGNVIGVIKSRIDESQGRPVVGIGFAIPINNVAISASVQSTPPTQSPLLPTLVPPTQPQLSPMLVPTARPVDTPFPTIPPTFDLAATKAAIDARMAFAQTKVAREREIERQKQEAEAYTRSAGATAVAQIPTATPRPTSTPTPIPTATPIPPTYTPLPTPTPHPATFCRQWEAMILEWIKLGNIYPVRFRDKITAQMPRHPVLSNKVAKQYCIQDFPRGQLRYADQYGLKVGTGYQQLLPGTYKYFAPSGDDRIQGGSQHRVYGSDEIRHGCYLQVNLDDNRQNILMEQGKPFEFQFNTSHGEVRTGWTGACYGTLYRIGD